MNYIRGISGSVSKTWNSINPSTLSGAIDVIVIEHEDGSLACSPFHVRFGKFSLLRPYEKKVEFIVNEVKQDYAMKLAEGGEAFFVFETSENIPEDMQTSPLVSPASSPPVQPSSPTASSLSEPEFLDLETSPGKLRPGSMNRPEISGDPKTSQPGRHYTEELLPTSARTEVNEGAGREQPMRSLTSSFPLVEGQSDDYNDRSRSPPPLPTREAIERAVALSNRLSVANMPSQVTDTGDLMLDMTGYKSSEDDALRAEAIARKVLSEELAGNYDIGALIGADEHANLWIYSSEEAKEAAIQRAALVAVNDAALDPGSQSESENDTESPKTPTHHRSASYSNTISELGANPKTPPASAGEASRNYAKTLRLTSDQLKAIGLKSGRNPMTFTVNRATCHANIFLWRYDVPIVISDIDGTITKSDALGQVLTMIGRDWTHIGVAKLYTEIVNNGYNIMYLTSRGVGQADATRAYLYGILQENYGLPRGPVILSPDRTIAALRRELYIRKPEVFKMACLRDIRNLFRLDRLPFYAGFGNKFTAALSYRTVSIPSNRIFTINTYSEVSLDLLSLNKLRYSYVNMREVVDHYFPPVASLRQQGGEEYTDFQYWREPVLDIDDFSASESEEGDEGDEDDLEEDDDAGNGGLGDSYISRDSIDDEAEERLANSVLSASIEEDSDQRTGEPHIERDRGAEITTGVARVGLERE
ncbi:hypothetical protein LLEC1_02936 [Akanthomyces lecanii]|uniref:LNS2/PITP domain-containing protein n=1 Tax=Cordyceps confragosa TaxID=2714763 RepID=A0A179ID22_CORDF|nr:hypothetical protein LLEC1_02936 [Akanthomyces lecanii]